VGVQCAAANALGMLGDSKAVDPLISMLNDENESARHAAVVALGNIGGPRVIKPLRDACSDSDSLVRDKAKRTLKELYSI